jgi:hypothetical protein
MIVPNDGVEEVEYRVQVGHLEARRRNDKVECMPDSSEHVFTHSADYQ